MVFADCIAVVAVCFNYSHALFNRASGFASFLEIYFKMAEWRVHPSCICNTWLFGYLYT